MLHILQLRLWQWCLLQWFIVEFIPSQIDSN